MRLVLRRGRFIRHAGIKVVGLSFPTIDSPTIGFMVSKRIEKKAVNRNRIKRVLRSAALSLIHDFLPSHCYVCVVDQKIVSPSTKTIEPILKQAIAIWNKENTWRSLFYTVSVCINAMYHLIQVFWRLPFIVWWDRQRALCVDLYPDVAITHTRRSIAMVYYTDCMWVLEEYFDVIRLVDRGMTQYQKRNLNHQITIHNKD